MAVILTNREWAAFMAGLVHGRHMHSGSELVETTATVNRVPITANKIDGIGIRADDVEIQDNSVGRRVRVPIRVENMDIGVAGFSLKVTSGYYMKIVGYSYGGFAGQSQFEIVDDGNIAVLRGFGQADFNMTHEFIICYVDVELLTQRDEYVVRVEGSIDDNDTTFSTLLTMGADGLYFITPMRVRSGTIKFVGEYTEKNNVATTQPLPASKETGWGSGGTGNHKGSLNAQIGNMTGGFSLTLSYIITGWNGDWNLTLSPHMIANGWTVLSGGNGRYTIGKYVSYNEWVVGGGRVSEDVDVSLKPDNDGEYKVDVEVGVVPDNDDDEPYILIPFGGFKFTFDVINQNKDNTIPALPYRIVWEDKLSIRDKHYIDIITNMETDTDNLMDKVSVYDTSLSEQITVNILLKEYSEHMSIEDSYEVLKRTLIKIKDLVGGQISLSDVIIVDLETPHVPTEYQLIESDIVDMSDAELVEYIKQMSGKSPMTDRSTLNDSLLIEVVSKILERFYLTDSVSIGDILLIE